MPLEVREYLNQVKHQTEHIETLERKIRELKQRMILPGMSYGERVQSSRNLHKMEDDIIKLIDLESELNAAHYKLMDLKLDLRKFIDLLEDKILVDLFYSKYIYLKSWNTIQDELRISRRWMFRLHAKGIRILFKILSNR